MLSLREFVLPAQAETSEIKIQAPIRALLITGTVQRSEGLDQVQEAYQNDLTVTMSIKGDRAGEVPLALGQSVYALARMGCYESRSSMMFDPLSTSAGQVPGNDTFTRFAFIVPVGYRGRALYLNEDTYLAYSLRNTSGAPVARTITVSVFGVEASKLTPTALRYNSISFDQNQSQGAAPTNKFVSLDAADLMYLPELPTPFVRAQLFGRGRDIFSGGVLDIVPEQNGWAALRAYEPDVLVRVPDRGALLTGDPAFEGVAVGAPTFGPTIGSLFGDRFANPTGSPARTTRVFAGAVMDVSEYEKLNLTYQANAGYSAIFREPLANIYTNPDSKFYDARIAEFLLRQQ